MPRPRKYPEELLERGVRLIFESGRPVVHVARDLGIHPETLRKRVRQAEPRWRIRTCELGFAPRTPNPGSLRRGVRTSHFGCLGLPRKTGLWN